ncbi:unnamed protein product [Owenia fusiformis]|uniref:Diaminopimelate epimerase n=1 Tax=Owenia fusiformis TaxID=6347 RepID=A0A8S4NS72_OWEFU|nr:unnamed protein product [Owenia fusiformis]
MSYLKNIPFAKYQASGEDCIIINNINGEFSTFLGDNSAVAVMCHRRFGVGADGVLEVRRHEKADFEVIWYNANGHKGTFCGNGTRCVVAYLYDNGIVSMADHVTIFACDGIHTGYEDNNKNIFITLEDIDAKNIEHIDEDESFINTGSPHHIRFIKCDSLRNIEFQEHAKSIRYSERYVSDGVNVNFVKVLSERDYLLEMRTYLRGLEGETIGCGTGSVAASICHHMRMRITDGLRDDVNEAPAKYTVKMEGGDQNVHFLMKNDADGNTVIVDITLSGEVFKVHNGLFYTSAFKRPS